MNTNMSKSNEQNEKEIQLNKNCYTVYMHISPSNKKYIGITKNKPIKRWDCGRGYKKNKYFWNAIQKYGWDNIEHIILYTELNEQDAKQKEIELISKYNSSDRRYGYNISKGGDLGNGNNMKKIYMYNSITGDFIRSFDSCNDAERFLNKSGSNIIGKHCSDNDFHISLGYLWRDKFVTKIDVINRDYIILLFDAITLKPIQHYNKLNEDVIYKNTLLKRSKIINCCNNRQYSYKNIFCCYAKDGFDLMVNYLSNYKHIKIVYQIDRYSNKIINSYFSYIEASKNTCALDTEISKVCRGLAKTAGGFKWESIGLIKGEDIKNKIKYISSQYFNDEDEDEDNYLL